jgi:RHS repeat-associated protein
MRTVQWSCSHAMCSRRSSRPCSDGRGFAGNMAATGAAMALAFLSGLGWAGESTPGGEAVAVVESIAVPELSAPDGVVVQDAVTMGAVAATTAAGRTPGSFGVSSSGAATYRIPIWTPPGVGSVELDLALTYNSRGGNGVLGQGWSLSGLSAISRCNRTIAQDGVPGAVTNTLADRYCLDGRQLKLVSGAYGMPGSAYATEIESFSRIVANGSVGNGPASFTVTSKNGLVYEYGSTADSQVYAGASGTIRTWALSRVRDRAATTSGNSIDIAYANEARNGAYTNGTYRVASISYPSTASGQGPFYRVSFSYTARPATDVVAGYLAGNRVQELNQLDSISITSYSTGATIKSYGLTYAQGTSSGRLQLRSVQECSAVSCLAPTTIGYQQGTTGWSASYVDTGHRASYKAGILPVDLNGDGLTDLLYPVGLGNGLMSWWVAFAQPGGYGTPVSTGVSADASQKLIPGRFLGNGRSQFIIPQGNYWALLDYNGSTFQQASTGLLAGGEFAAADIDGDGLDDLISMSTSPTTSIRVRRNTTLPAPGPGLATFAPTSDTAWTVPSTRQSRVWESLKVADFNGDGRADFAMHSFVTTKRGGAWLTPLLSNGFGVPFTVGVERDFWIDAPLTFGDWNADGCSDILQGASVFISNCAGDFTSIATGAAGLVYDSNGNAALIPVDWDDDGRTDLVYLSSWGGSGNSWYVVRSTGTGAASPVATGVGAPKSTAWFALDADGDGRADLAFRDDNHNGDIRYHPHKLPGVSADLATSFTDGFGMSQSPSYVSIAAGSYTRHSDAVFPEVDFAGPLYVVSQFAASDGTGSTYKKQFQYYGARVHLQGRGFEGFHSQRVYDSRSGSYTFDYLQRAFPYTGLHTQRVVWQSNLSSKVSEWNATVGQQALGPAGAEQRVFPYLASVTDSRYEVGGSLDGILVTRATEAYAYGDGQGNRTEVRRAVTDKDPGSPFLNSSWQTTTTSTFANDTTSNCLGLPTSTVVTQSVPGQAAQTRATAYSVDTGPCRITQQVLEPGSPTQKVTTTLAFDACGNVSSLQVVGSTPGGSPMQARTTSFGYGARCQLPESMTNPLGEATSVGYQYDFGVPVTVTDSNNLTTSWNYDDFGRRIQETRPDRTTTSWSFESCATGPCWGVNDLRFHVYETSKGAAADVYDQCELLYDGYDRLRSIQYMRVLGAWTTETFLYDSLGRLTTRYRPYSGAGNGYAAWTYDLLDRVASAKLVQPTGAVDRTATLGYSGRTLRVTDTLGRTRTKVVDVAGRLRRVTDPSPGGATAYEYDAFGQLNRVQDPIGAVSSGTYNLRGFRTKWADADRGTWTFAGNSLNELVSWTDARGQSFGATYDALGRLTTRTEPDGTSTWTWGNSAAAHNVGRLQSAAGYGYTESLAYDGVGRVASRTISTDQAYQYDYTYNSIGALDTVAYPASPVPAGTNGARFRVQYGYSYGAPVRISDVTQSPGTVLWSLNAANDYSSATSETLGANLLSVASGYKAWTNELTSRQSGLLPATSNRQNLAYQWDAAGNLTQRQDLNQSLTESFTVDALDRVQSSALNGVGNLAVAYDASGNITGRSDVGSYAYGDAAHPHAVTAAGSHAYTYDANGNQITRDGASQAWASFNLPVLIAQPIGGTTYQSQFSYGPDHQRWRQIASYSNGTETTLYAGGLLEKENTTPTGKTYWRHYVPTPSGMTIVVSRNSDATTSTAYLLTDHLGSSDATLDSSGNVVARQSFAAFGARRGGDWRSGSTPDWAGIANTSRHGYTGHEHLDNLGLIHMGGRVYDPLAGRFMSVDPMVADLGDSQTLNPYAYVGNRPLVSTDPSGLCLDGCVIETIIFQAASSAILSSILAGNDLPRPPATVLPGQSAQTGMGMCGPGQSTPACGGLVLYAAAPSARGSAVPTSTWVNEPDDAGQGARENLEQLLIDLGTNTIDVLILGPYHDARGTYDAARQGDYFVAVIYAGMTICDIAKECEAANLLLKPVARAAKGLKRAGRGVRDVARSIPTPVRGQKLYRVYGGDSKAGGASWSPVRPDSVPNYRDAAGLPSGKASQVVNSGQYVIEGTLMDPDKVVKTRRALPVDGNTGRLPEYVVPGWQENGAIRVDRVSGVNPEF